MKPFLLRPFAVLLLGMLLAGCASAQQKFTPQVGQAGKDVIWVPTPDEVVDRMLAMAQVTPQDFVMDLGSGDGKIAIAAAKKFGARALGIEYNPDMVKLAQDNAQAAGVAGRASFRRADIFQTDLSEATVITLYLLPSLNLKLRPQLLRLRPGTRVVSHSFTMDDWDPDEVSEIDGRRAYFWLVPAAVAGTWQLEAGNGARTLALEQQFQKIAGSIGLAGAQAGLRDAVLHGADIAFAYVGEDGVRRDFSGRVEGNHMAGTLRDGRGGEGRWSATKK